MLFIFFSNLEFLNFHITKLYMCLDCVIWLTYLKDKMTFCSECSF